MTLVGSDHLSVIAGSNDKSSVQSTQTDHTALLQQAGVAAFTLGGEQGQQVYVITDPAQLEALQVINSSVLFRERSGSVVEFLTWDGEVAGSSLTGVTALCPWARHINPCLALVQCRKTRSDITDFFYWDVKNQFKQTNHQYFAFKISAFALTAVIRAYTLTGN